MYHKVATKLVLSPGTVATTELSRAVEMEEHNGALFDVTLKGAEASINTLEIGLEGSSDLSNWTSIKTLDLDSPPTVPDYQTKDAGGPLVWPYVRLRYYVNGGGSVMLAAGIDTYETD